LIAFAGSPCQPFLARSEQTGPERTDDYEHRGRNQHPSGAPKMLISRQIGPAGEDHQNRGGDHELAQPRLRPVKARPLFGRAVSDQTEPERVGQGAAERGDDRVDMDRHKYLGQGD
jgi:hypothetical protein